MSAKPMKNSLASVYRAQLVCVASTRSVNSTSVMQSPHVGVAVGALVGIGVGNGVVVVGEYVCVGAGVGTTLGFGVGRSVGSTVGMTAVGGWRLMGDAIATFAVVASVHAHG